MNRPFENKNMAGPNGLYLTFVYSWIAMGVFGYLFAFLLDAFQQPHTSEFVLNQGHLMWLVLFAVGSFVCASKFTADIIYKALELVSTSRTHSTGVLAALKKSRDDKMPDIKP